MTPTTIIKGFLLLIAATRVVAAANTPPPPPVQDWNTPVGLRAVESFSGADHAGKDGVMARVGFDLTLLYQEHRDFILRGGAAVLKHGFQPSQKLARVRDEKVVIDAVAVEDAGLLAQELVALGMKNLSIYGKVVSGRLPVAALEQAAQLGSLRLVRPAYAAAMTGTVTSQGDAALGADDARSGFAVDGTGITIGTLSDSYDCRGGAAADVASNDLPGGIQVLQDEAGCSSGSDEGRAMMQIIHDVAPGASQAFHTAFNGSADFANGILELATIAGADIINDDVFYYAEPMFQDGIIAQAVDTVAGMGVGVAYFSSAGNQADQSYEDTFRNSGAVGASGGLRHDFDPGAGVDSLMQVTIPGNTQVILVLQWDDPYYSVSGAPGADTDMDIVLYSNSGKAKAASIDNNLGGDPVEVLAYVTPPGPTRTYQIGIEHAAGPFPAKIKFVYFGAITINEFDTHSGTSYGHAMAAGAQAVGAARYSHTPEYGVSPPLLEYFSSRGGIPILFDTSGNPASEVRQKPEIVAPDGGDNTFFGSDYEGNSYPNFFGTSAAAPHAAGLAALLKQFDNTLGPDAIYTAMQSTAIDMGAPGVDIDSGYGLVQAVPALESLDDDLDGIPDSGDNCPVDANPGQDNNDGDVPGDVCDDDDDNDGLTDSFEGTIGTDPFLVDTDSDTLTDGDEVNLYSTDPVLADSDGDGFDDGVEITAGSDPNSNTSIPGLASGDVNGDGSVNTADVLLAYRIAVDGLTPAMNQLLRGDIAPIAGGVSMPDGVINAADLLVIQQLALGLR